MKVSKKFYWVVALTMAACGYAIGAQAGNLSCAQDDDTFAMYCYVTKSVKTNGDLRATELYTGGPKGVSDSGYLSVINCKAGYLEMRDKKGVAFTRGVPEKRHIRAYRDFVCGEKNPKQDNALK